MASDYLIMNNENLDLVYAVHPKTCLPFMVSVFGIPIVIRILVFIFQHSELRTPH